jgi:hypothetical protein
MSPLLCGILLLVNVPCGDPRILTNDKAQICMPGYSQAARGPYTLAPRHGYERDHLLPVCLGGASVPSNEWYQPLSEARIKDRMEIAMCRAVCDGEEDIDAAQEFFLSGHWKELMEEQ